MSKPKRYELVNIWDVFNIPLDRFDAFTAELKEIRELEESRRKSPMAGLDAISVMGKITWVDDDLGEMHAHYRIQPNDETPFLDLNLKDFKE